MAHLVLIRVESVRCSYVESMRLNSEIRYCLLLSIAMLAAAATVSCGGRNHRLAHVEMLLETDPVQADSVLSSIPVPRSRGGRALYAILRTQADYKNYKDIEDDKLISTATDYYGNRKKGYHAAMPEVPPFHPQAAPFQTQAQSYSQSAPASVSYASVRSSRSNTQT